MFFSCLLVLCLASCGFWGVESLNLASADQERNEYDIENFLSNLGTRRAFGGSDPDDSGNNAYEDGSNSGSPAKHGKYGKYGKFGKNGKNKNMGYLDNSNYNENNDDNIDGGNDYNNDYSGSRGKSGKNGYFNNGKNGKNYGYDDSNDINDNDNDDCNDDSDNYNAKTGKNILFPPRNLKIGRLVRDFLHLLNSIFPHLAKEHSSARSEGALFRAEDMKKNLTEDIRSTYDLYDSLEKKATAASRRSMYN